MDDAPNNPKMPDRAWVARETNSHIRRLAKSLRDERPVGFFCECGCMEIVLVTIVDYDEHGGAWLDGHKLEQPPHRFPPH
jgi:hypothetical protein